MTDKKPIPINLLLDKCQDMTSTCLEALIRIAQIAVVQKNVALGDILVEVNKKLLDTRRSFDDFVKDYMDEV